MLHTDNPELPVELWCGFISPQCRKSVILEEKELRNDGKCFIFPTAELYDEIDAEENKEYNYNIFSFAEEDKHTFDSLCGRYIHCSEFERQKGAVAKMWDELLKYMAQKSDIYYLQIRSLRIHRLSRYYSGFLGIYINRARQSEKSNSENAFIYEK